MKSVLLILVSISLLSLVGCKKDPKSEKEKVSYSIGNQIGSNIKRQKIDLDVKMLAQSLQEAIDGKDSRMTPQEMQKTMRDLHQKRMKDMSKNKAGDSKKAAENKKAGIAFLAKNKSEKDIKVTKSGLQYKVLKEGKGKKPKASSVVKVNYAGTLIDGKEFDKSKKPIEFPVGGVISGWTEALQLMKTGAKWKLFIPSDLAYGPSGRPGIPPNSVLIFEVELIKIVK